MCHNHEGFTVQITFTSVTLLTNETNNATINHNSFDSSPFLRCSSTEISDFPELLVNHEVLVFQYCYIIYGCQFNLALCYVPDIIIF